MSTAVLMPALAEGMEEGTILAWLVADGAEVAVGDDLVEVETDKASMVYAAEAAGVLHRLVEEGATVTVGAPIAELRTAGAAAVATVAANGAGAAGAVAVTAAPAPPRAGAPPARPKASPVARRVAAALDLDLATLRGSGPGGRIVRADVEAARAAASKTPTAVAPSTPATPAAPEGVRRIVLGRAQRTVARRMVQAKTEIPEFRVGVRADVSACLALRAELREEQVDPLPTLNDLVVKAAAAALAEHPRAIARWADGAIDLVGSVNVGIAVAVGDDLVVPVVANADRKSLREVARESRTLAGRARDGALTPADVSGGTFTISNLGMFGIESFEAIVNPPQAAILAVGAAVDTVVPDEGEVAVRPLMTLTLACDHRVLYGAHAAALLQTIRRNLERPSRFLA
jgi:pyruvate dehydrogenase E2 component (dihydrolipoamide acetyltransferase)